MRSFWNRYRLTGDNSRERPYAVVYPRVTTQSNTYRIHYWVETLKKNTATDPTVFIDPDNENVVGSKDAVKSRLRGNFVVERFLEPDDTKFGGSINPLTDSFNPAYKFRVIQSTIFSP